MKEIIFKRKAYKELLKWKKECAGTRAVLLEGARRVGKSTIAEEFAKKEYKSYILVDFSKADEETLSVFDDIHNLNLFFTRIQMVSHVKLYERESVLIFDEVQLRPQVRQAIKHLVADGRYDYIETGSLISIKKNVEKILIPSEERKIEVFPMDYEEFCDALGLGYENLRELYKLKAPIGEAVNRKLIREFRLYLAIGGMPQAVASFVSGKNFDEIDAVKRDIISLYKDDLRKVDGSGRISKMFESVPAQLVAKKNRFSFGYCLGKKSAKDDERLSDLLESKIVNACYRLDDVSPSFSLDTDLTDFKLYLGDTGLFVTMLLNRGEGGYEDLYRKLLGDKLELNLGYLYENAVAQMITSAGRDLRYFTFAEKDGKRIYEIDFLLGKGGKAIPLEVKSSKVNKHDSIDRFAVDYSKRLLKRYLVSSKDYFKDKDLVNLPFYLLPCLLDDLASPNDK